VIAITTPFSEFISPPVEKGLALWLALANVPVASLGIKKVCAFQLFLLESF
jgi:hypothetical protein